MESYLLAGAEITMQRNRFNFVKNDQLTDITVLHAEMHDFSYDKHAHEEYSFGVTLTGRQDFFSGGAKHHSHPGNIVVFNPGEVHDGHSGAKEPLRYNMVYIPPAQLEPMLASAGIRQIKDFQVAKTILKDESLRRSIQKLTQLLRKSCSTKLEVECALFQLATCLARHHGQFETKQASQKVDRLLILARDFIHGHLGEELTLDEISKAANLSKYHFLRLFNRQFGITPHQCIVNCRINQARKALEAGKSVNDLVYEYGFSDVSHFNRRFKPIYGITPRQYQLSLKR